MTPEYRAFLDSIRRSRVSPESILEEYFALCEGTSEDLGRAHDLAACLVDPSRERGYMDFVWRLAYDWIGAAQGRYDIEDLVASTAEEILRALPRPSSRQAVSKGWLWFCKECFKRARQQAGLNGDKGYKSISARAVRDAQKQLAHLDGTQPDEDDDDIVLDNVVLEGGVMLDEEIAPADDHEVLRLDHFEGESTLADEKDTILQEDGYDRLTVANEMVRALGDLSPNTDYTTYEWLQAFVDEYRATYVAGLDDADRRAVAEAVLDGIPTSRDGKLDCEPLLEMLNHLSRDRINELKKQERIHFKAALVREARRSGAVDDDFVRSILERSRTGRSPWKQTGLPSR